MFSPDTNNRVKKAQLLAIALAKMSRLLVMLVIFTSNRCYFQQPYLNMACGIATHLCQVIFTSTGASVGKYLSRNISTDNALRKENIDGFSNSKEQ